MQAEIVANVVYDEDNGDSEVHLNDVCQVNIVVSLVVDVVVDNDVVDHR